MGVVNGVPFTPPVGMTTYTALSTETVDCPLEAVVVVNVLPTANTILVDSNVSCNGFADGGATSSATGGTSPYTYLWSNSATTASLTGVVAGTYSVTITDGSGCSDMASVTITEPTALAASSVVDSNVSCNGFTDGGATSSATGGTSPYTYLWSNSATTASITGEFANSYTLWVTDANGCTDTSDVVNTEPVVITGVDSQIACESFTWIDGVTYTSSNNSATFTLSNQFGCDSIVTLDLTVNTANSVVDTQLACESYTWIDGNTYTSSNNTATFTLSNVNGCDSIVTLDLTIQPELIVTANITDVYTGQDGAIDLTVTGGVAPYTFSWPNIQSTDQNIDSLYSGYYQVTVTDAFGCTYIETFQVESFLSIDELDSDLLIYPNPTVDFIKIETNFNIEKVLVYSSEGKLVKAVTDNVIRLENSPNGLYYLRIVTDNGTFSRKIIKN